MDLRTKNIDPCSDYITPLFSFFSEKEEEELLYYILIPLERCIQHSNLE